jgi:hypothetical protein
MTLFQTPPTRVCCGQPHWTVECPDGRVMCALCFDRVTKDELMKDMDGDLWDMCQRCGLIENLCAIFLVMTNGINRR